MRKSLIISCEDVTSQSPYAYEQRAESDCPEEEVFCCPYDKFYFEDNLGGGDSDPIVTENGEYFTLSD